MPSCLQFSKLSSKRNRHRQQKTFSVDQSSDSGSSHRPKALSSVDDQNSESESSKPTKIGPGLSPPHQNSSQSGQTSAGSYQDSNRSPASDALSGKSLSGHRSSELRIFSYSELRAATRNFSRAHLLGEGGFGRVYKGQIRSFNSDGQDCWMPVAVKQLKEEGQQGHKEWLAEVRILGLVEHPNLVKLVGYCAEDYERGMQRLLVYEYMRNGSLEAHLFRRGATALSWQSRLRILLGAAQGLAYLHEEINGIQIIFRDFKTSNVLLDDEFAPKLFDFGMARQGPEVGESHVSTAVVGTLGYAAPEYIQTGHLTSKSDVWSFGVVLLEMLSGRRTLDRTLPKHEKQLLDLAKPYLQGNKKVQDIMDPRLEGHYSVIQAQGIVALAQQCLHKHARSRPLMSDVVEKLKEIVEGGDMQPDSLDQGQQGKNELVDKKQNRARHRRFFFL